MEAGGVGADEVALDEVAPGVLAVDVDADAIEDLVAITIRAGTPLMRARCLLPEIRLPAPATVPPIVLSGDAVDEDADVVRQGLVAGLVGADVVALDQVARRTDAEDLDADAVAGGSVARDDVARAGRRAADRVVGRVVDVTRRLPSVAHGEPAGHVGADDSCPRTSVRVRRRR